MFSHTAFHPLSVPISFLSHFNSYSCYCHVWNNSYGMFFLSFFLYLNQTTKIHRIKRTHTHTQTETQWKKEREKKPESIHMYKNTACKQSYHNLHDTDTTLLSRRCRLLAKRQWLSVKNRKPHSKLASTIWGKFARLSIYWLIRDESGK